MGTVPSTLPMYPSAAPTYRTMRTLFTVPILLSKPYLKKVANRALLLKIDKLYYTLLYYTLIYFTLPYYSILHFIVF